MLHFAYGSNMSRELMRPRCPGAREAGPAILEQHRFMVMAEGYASVVPCAGAVVHGLLWRLTPRHLAVLGRYEGLDRGLYRAVTLSVRTPTGRMPALVYIGRSRAPGRPDPGYLAVVLAAAREHGFPAAYVAALARLSPGRFAAARAAEAGGLA